MLRSCSAISSTTPRAKANHDNARIAALHDAIAGIAIEDAYHRGGKDENNHFHPDKETIKEVMAAYGKAGELVLAVDYVSKTDKVAHFLKKAEKDGFVPYASPDRDLGGIALHGTPDADSLVGTGGSDRIYGRGGNDTIAGGPGKDIALGGPGKDRFDFDTTLGKGTGKAGVDILADFKPGKDMIGLDATVFAAIGPTLDAGEFRKGGKTKDGNDFALLKKSGALFYDADGNGDGAKIKFAKLGATKGLDHDDFLVI
jgi:Ca2+-binding RTX toxin-like protein